MKVTVYILQYPDGRFYIGQTNNLSDRLERHNQGRVPYTKGKGSWILVHQEEYMNRADAMRREKQVKKWRRALIQSLIG